MTLRIANIPLSLDEEESSLRPNAARMLQIEPESISEFKIIRKSLDARKKNRIHFVYTVDLSLPPEEEEKILRNPPGALQVRAAPPLGVPGPAPARKRTQARPVVVGTGPAGIFAALRLAESGVPPLVVERGKEVSSRVKDVERFWEEGILDPESNVQFGEGGAGTFSDGKLYTRLNDPRISYLLETFVRFGAPAEILYLQKPHIGTDRLRRVVIGLRRFLQGKGAEFRFGTKVTAHKNCPGRLGGRHPER